MIKSLQRLESRHATKGWSPLTAVQLNQRVSQKRSQEEVEEGMGALCLHCDLHHSYLMLRIVMAKLHFTLQPEGLQFGLLQISSVQVLPWMYEMLMACVLLILHTVRVMLLWQTYLNNGSQSNTKKWVPHPLDHHRLVLLLLVHLKKGKKS
jgi:hypothetical protein